MREKFLTFGAPLIQQPEIDEVVDSLRSGWLGTGPKVKKFAELFRARIGACAAVAVNSCTAALHLSLIAAGVGLGDEVITTDMTFVATANAIVHCGARPVLVDCERDTGLISTHAVEEAITARTKAILPVHLYGRPCAMDELMRIAARRGCVVIEDAAHAVGAAYRGRSIGTIGQLTCFSFYVTKNLTTGEGGMVTTGDEELSDKIRMYSLHGLTRDAWRRYSAEPFAHYLCDVPGFKYNMTDIQAALGMHQLGRLDSMAKRRSEIWKRYSEAFKDLPLGLPPEEESHSVHAHHLYTVLIEKKSCGLTRDQFAAQLFERKIGSGIHFVGVHLHPYYQKRFGYHPGDFPNSSWISERTLSLPFSAALTDADVEDVISAIKNILG